MIISPGSMRRYALAAIVAIWALVIGGLSWATQSAIILDHAEARNDHRTSFDERRLRALWRLDTIVGGVLAREQGRSYEQFRPYHVKRVVESGNEGVEVLRNLPSELKALTRAKFILLHFQVSETDDADTSAWKSPQIEPGSPLEMSVSGLPVTDRGRATEGNWLSALRERYSPADLVRVVEGTRDWRESLLRRKPGSEARQSDSEATLVGRSEFVRRAQRFVESFPPEQCVPQLVAMENLDAGPTDAPVAHDATGCVPIIVTPMIPVWLDLTLDDRPQLALVRTVHAEGVTTYCTLQGVLLDWERLKEELEGDILDLIPAGRLAPVFPNTELPHEALNWKMGTLDARLVPGESTAFVPVLTDGLRVGLWTAWSATLLALIAITYGILRYFASADRRIRFVAAVTHELRTPLTTFQLYSDLLADSPEGLNPRQLEYVETIRDESKRLGRLVENVLAYARMGRQGPLLRVHSFAPFDLLELVRLETAHRCKFADKELVIEDQCPPGTRVETDSEFVVQILANLVENACKYSAGASDSRIWLSAAIDGQGHMVFEVDDAGAGVAHGERRVVFQPFRRGRNGKTDATTGMGLGLALSRYWARCLGGDLSVKRSPRNESHLSCFVLSLPGASVNGRELNATLNTAHGTQAGA